MEEIRRAVERKGGGQVEYLQLDLACLRCGYYLSVLVCVPWYARRTSETAVTVLADSKQRTCICRRSVERSASDFKRRGLALDILVNNAAAIVPTDAISVDGIEQTMATNHFGEAPAPCTLLLEHAQYVVLLNSMTA